MFRILDPWQAEIGLVAEELSVKPEFRDGRPVPGSQAVKDGVPLWQIRVQAEARLFLGFEAWVTIPSADAPNVRLDDLIVFERLKITGAGRTGMFYAEAAGFAQAEELEA